MKRATATLNLNALGGLRFSSGTKISHFRPEACPEVIPNTSTCSACVESWDIDSLWGIAARLAEGLTLRVLGL